MLSSALGRAGAVTTALALTMASAVAVTTAPARAGIVPLFHPTVSDYAQVSASETPPTEAQCFSAGRRCFTPQSTRAAYNLNPTLNKGTVTIKDTPI